jgi:hypothetical protein
LGASVIIREFERETDEPLLYSTWCFGLYYGSAETSHTTKKEFFKKQSAYIKPLLESATIKIACLSDDPDTILGYSVIDQGCVEWIFVKERLRRQGIAKLLLKNQNPTHVKKLTKIGKLLADKYGLKEKDDEQGRTGTGFSGVQPETEKDYRERYSGQKDSFPGGG